MLKIDFDIFCAQLAFMFMLLFCFVNYYYDNTQKWRESCKYTSLAHISALMQYNYYTYRGYRIFPTDNYKGETLKSFPEQTSCLISINDFSGNQERSTNNNIKLLQVYSGKSTNQLVYSYVKGRWGIKTVLQPTNSRNTKVCSDNNQLPPRELWSFTTGGGRYLICLTYRMRINKCLQSRYWFMMFCVIR